MKGEKKQKTIHSKKENNFQCQNELLVLFLDQK